MKTIFGLRFAAAQKTSRHKLRRQSLLWINSAGSMDSRYTGPREGNIEPLHLFVFVRKAAGKTAMSSIGAAVDRQTLGLHSPEHYEPLIGSEKAQRIRKKAERVSSLRLAHISSTFYGGGVTEILTPLTLMLNAMGVSTNWHLIQGTNGFFRCTKKLHNTLQGEEIDLVEEEMALYEQVVFENATRLPLEECDVVVVHDPQPLPLINYFGERDIPWLWQCHVDLSSPYPATWNYLARFVEKYDTAIFSLPEYAQSVPIKQRFIAPAIDPFSAKNMDLSDQQIAECLNQYRIPTDLPLVTQISRFDRWKDPVGVIDAYRKARKDAPCTLVLLGNNASDDPEGEVILETIKSYVDDRIIILAVDDPILVNALQRRSAVILQKSLREGFGLTVTEAMWKGAAVVGGDVGGIRKQITDGENGFLVSNSDQAATHIVQLLKDEKLRERIGSSARETVRENYLMSRLAEDWLDLLVGYERRLLQ